MAVFAMEQGKHAATEVPAAGTLADCWRLVDTSERTHRHCVMLENCCYGDSEMMVLNMARQGLFGELTHGEAAYIHDLRDELFSDAGEGLWRRTEHTERDGNLYPTHGLGPVAQYMGINRGDRFETLVSLSSLERGLSVYRARHVPRDSPKWRERYVCGDINTSVLRTRLGRTVMLQHDTVSPRPYSRHNLLSGTKGTFAGYPDRIFLDGQSQDWEDADKYREKYRHPLWQKSGEMARKLGGHGGMDFIMAYRLIESIRQGEAPDMDVYDAAAWSAPGPLSVLSVANGGASVEFPDFTRGGWQKADRG
jgi:predicted dehydrogenase